MPVQISDERAREIAGILERLDDAIEAEYNTGSIPARVAAEELREAAGPPREPIRHWVEDNQHRFVIPDGKDAEDVVDEIVAAIDQAGDSP